MEKTISFENNGGYTDLCTGSKYFDFIDYAFSKTDYFMLVFINYNQKGYSKITKTYLEKLKRFKYKSRTNPIWPGSSYLHDTKNSYKIVFYKTDLAAKEILKTVNSLSDWSYPLYPQDLAFFIGNKCWFYSIGHEREATIVRASEQDLDFIEYQGLANRTKAKCPSDDFCLLLDEEILPKQTR